MLLLQESICSLDCPTLCYTTHRSGICQGHYYTRLGSDPSACLQRLGGSQNQAEA